jgi:hypothetical protein
MAAQLAFRALLTRIGFTQPAIVAMEANGITSPQDLVNLDKKDIEQILKIIRTGPPPVVVPYLAQKKLNTYCYWATRRNRLQEPIEAALFTQAALDNYGSMMALEAKEEEIVVKPPAEYKTGTKWKAFKEGAIAYLNGIKGNHNIPLAYIIHHSDIPQVGQIYGSEHQRLIEVTPLTGPAFEDDNGKVFDLLKS